MILRAKSDLFLKSLPTPARAGQAFAEKRASGVA